MKSRIRQYDSTGMGLALCKRLVELMQREIPARARPGMERLEV